LFRINTQDGRETKEGRKRAVLRKSDSVSRRKGPKTTGLTSQKERKGKGKAQKQVGKELCDPLKTNENYRETKSGKGVPHYPDERKSGTTKTEKREKRKEEGSSRGKFHKKTKETDRDSRQMAQQRKKDDKHRTIQH